MSLKDSMSGRFGRLTRNAGPVLRGLVGQQVVRFRSRLDAFNQSLADRALPEDRKKMVGRLALAQKARVAKQSSFATGTTKAAKLKTARKPRG